MSNMKAYIAAPIFNEHQLAVVGGMKDLLEDLGYNVFSPYHASREIWKGRAPKDCTDHERRTVLVGNIMNLERPTNLLIAWVGGTENGKVDTGVAWEMGYFHSRIVRSDYGPEQPPPMCLAYIDTTDKRQDMNLMLAGTVDAAARGAGQLQRAIEMHAQRRFSSFTQKFHPSLLVQQESVEMAK